MTRKSGKHCVRHKEPLDSCFNLIRSHQQYILESATTDCRAETQLLSHWPTSHIRYILYMYINSLYLMYRALFTYSLVDSADVFFILTRYLSTIWLFSNSSCAFSLFFFIEFFPQISVCIIFFANCIICFFVPTVRVLESNYIYIYIYILGWLLQHFDMC